MEPLTNPISYIPRSLNLDNPSSERPDYEVKKLLDYAHFIYNIILKQREYSISHPN